jgi:saccharopine dehydrogenase-like NADP-dependent oxidoreductase
MKVLLLGAGMVAKPLADYILNNQIELTIASRTLAKAEKLIGNHANGKALQWTIDDLNCKPVAVCTPCNGCQTVY